jgi:hypothetical protein
MNKVNIIIEKLSKQNWGKIYDFIDKFCKNDASDLDSIVCQMLRENIYITADSKVMKDSVPYDFSIDSIKTLSAEETLFSIIYRKNDTSREVSNIVPFCLLAEKYPYIVSLGIDINIFATMEEDPKFPKAKAFIFMCSTLLQRFYGKQTVDGNSVVYFIHERLSNNEGFKYNFSGLRNQADDKNVSRHIFPLSEVSTPIFHSLFGNSSDKTAITMGEKGIVEYLRLSIGKIESSALDGCKTIFKSDIAYRNIFEEWFIKAYFYSLKRTELQVIRANNVTPGLIDLLKSYCDNIKELVENFIFYTDAKKGFIYVVFHEKGNLTEERLHKLVVDNSFKGRFVEVGIIDSNQQGITDKYNEDGEKVYNLVDLFDPSLLHSKGMDHLYLRYAAHLGIKTFASSVKKHKGLFSVESNSAGKGKERVEYSPAEDKFNYTEHSTLLPGTHYEILFPVNSESNAIKQYHRLNTTLQAKPFDWTPDGLEINNPIKSPVIDFLSEDINSKDEQEKYISAMGQRVLVEADNDIKLSHCVAIDIDSTLPIMSVNLLMKLVSYIQGNSAILIKHIILYNIKEESKVDGICDIIRKCLIESDNRKIWSRDSALILISKQLRYQIITGETKEELGYVNHEMCARYFNKNTFSDYYTGKPKIDDEELTKLNDYIRPYECFIKIDDGDTLFHQYLSNEVLENSIDLRDIGCRVTTPFTRIGHKIIIKNYYEADFLFSNKFFVDRFAFFIATEIRDVIVESKTSRLILIGYHPYSQLLVNKVRELVNKWQNSEIIQSVITAQAREEDNGLSFTKEKNNQFSEDYKYATIVPIASTLSTNDKMVALFKASHSGVEFVYHHCTILVRDNCASDKWDAGNGITPMEESQKWLKQEVDSHKVTTKFKGANEIYFFIAKTGSWLPLINNDTYPSKYWKEKPVNQTSNSSLNSRNLFGYPAVAIPKEYRENKEKRRKFYNLTVTRLNELKPYIYWGHIDFNKDHHRYYIDTEAYVKDRMKDGEEKGSEFQTWIDDLAKSYVEGKNGYIDILVTPDVKIEPYFINHINQSIFDNNALIVYVDVSGWRNNVKCKLSYLMNIYETEKKNIRFHFVDHVMLTSSTYRKAESYMRTILNDFHGFHFYSIIVLINRLSHDRYGELMPDTPSSFHIHSFTHLFIPPSKEPGEKCSLCELKKYYEKLRERSVVNDCRQIIDHNISKLKEKNFKKDAKNGLLKVDDKPRYFMRMQIMHEIFFEISNLVEDYSEGDINKKISDMLMSLYHGYDDYDHKISFLKNISSFPSSHYIWMRSFAHNLLLSELNAILTMQGTPSYDDLCLLRVILKQLSMLGANALVRKDVIIGAWDLYFKYAIDNADRIKSKEDSILKLKEEEKASTTALSELTTKIGELLKSPEMNNRTFFDSDTIELQQLYDSKNAAQKRQAEVVEKLSQADEELKELKEPKIKIDDFGRDFQFYIKNATDQDEAKSMWLGELLRTGKEMLCDPTGSYINDVRKTDLNNELFLYFADIPLDSFRKMYLNFLVHTFYDNTTIIRNTLENFHKELNKNEELEGIFSKHKLVDEKFDIDSIKKSYNKEIEEQYYYSSISKYIGKGDEIDWVEKLSYVLQAKLVLKEISTNENNDSFEDNIRNLLFCFAKIMGAGSAFFAMKRTDSDVYVVKSYNISEEELIQRQRRVTDDSYVFQLMTETKSNILPLILKEQKKNFYEFNGLGAERLVCLLIHQQNKLVGVFTFLFKAADHENADSFRIKSQEYGRLLLLLKTDLECYIKDVLSEKILELWAEKIENAWKFEKIYRDNRHVFKNVFLEMSKFEEITELDLPQMVLPWFAFTNQMVSFLYSDIERRYPNALGVTDDTIIRENTTLGEIFNEKFRIIIYGLFEEKWKQGKKHCIDFPPLSEELKDVSIDIRVDIVRAYIAQCLDNSFKYLTNGGHCLGGEEKVVHIQVTKQSIAIIEHCTIPDEKDQENKKKRIEEFNKRKRKNIEQLNCNAYSSTTLTSMQGVIDFMNNKNGRLEYSLTYGYFKRSDFTVKMTFKNRKKNH